MKRVALSFAVAGLASSTALAADMAVKSLRWAGTGTPRAAGMGCRHNRRIDVGLQFPRHHAVEPPAVGRGLAWSRATTINKSLQGYVGVSGESIDFPNRAAAEIDFYGGIRPTFGKLALDFGS